MLDKIKLICRNYDIKPSRSKGQNFLVSEKVLNKTVVAAELKKTDTVLEIGPGLGILTEELIKSSGRVISVELDKKLFSFLQTKFLSAKNLELINDDILKFEPRNYQLTAGGYKIVANLPYNITSYFLRKFLTMEHRPETMVLMLQKEVAKRVCAKPGKLSLLAISVQFYGQPEIIDYVERKNFYPTPDVDSAILRISEIKSVNQINHWLSDVTEKQYWRLVKIGFSAKRKKLVNNLAAGLKISPEKISQALESLNLDVQIRAQGLSIGDWLALAKILKSYLN